MSLHFGCGSGVFLVNFNLNVDFIASHQLPIVQRREVGSLFHVIGIRLRAVLGVHGLQLLLAPVLDDGGCIAVAEHVVRGSEPVDKPVDGEEKRYVRGWQIDGCENDDYENKCSTWHTGTSNAGSGCRNDNSCVLPNTERDFIHLSYEDGADGHEQGCSVHVDCGTDGKHEAGDSGIHAAFVVHASEGDRQRSRPAKGNVVSMCLGKLAV